MVSLNLGLDLALNYQEGPSQSVRFNDPSGELESSGVDTDIVLAQMDGEGASGWNTAIRPQLQLEFQPGFSDRFSFNVKTGIQHHLSDREMTYTERDLSRVIQVDSPFEMHHQFENAPVVQRTESAPRTNFFANAGITIRFGGGRAAKAPAQDYNSSRSNKPSTIADIGDGDLDSDDDGIGDAVETAQDYNSSRSNKPSTENDRGGDGEIVREAVTMARLANPAGMIVKVGSITAKGKKALGLGFENANSPIYEGDAVGGENVLNRDEMNDGDSAENSNGETIPVQRFQLQPSSYCVELSTMKISTNSQKAMRSGQSGGMTSDDNTAMATSHNASRSNRSQGINNQGSDTDIDADSTDVAPATSHNASRSNRSQGINNQGGDTDIDADSTDVAPATSHNASRSNRSQGITDQGSDTGSGTSSDSISTNGVIPPSINGIAVDDPTNLKPNTDQDGFPVIMKGASFSISKRSARTGRSQSPIYESETNSQTNPMYESEGAQSSGGGDLDGDGYGDVDGFHFELEIDDSGSNRAGVVSDQVLKTFFQTGDKPTASQTGPSTGTVADELNNATASATYSFSMVSTQEAQSSDNDPCGPGVWARTTGGSENCAPENTGQENPLAQESGWQETPALEAGIPNNIHQWTYKLNALSGDGELPGNGTLTVMFTGRKLHFNVHIDPDDDGDGLGDLLQNSSFSISKRSARTGRNPQTGRGIE
jgi:nucleoid DNA-binding protein